MRSSIALALALALAAPQVARAAEVVFYVGGEEADMKPKAEAAGGKWTKENIGKALGWAAEALKGSDKHVVIKMAAGDYPGQIALPSFSSPKGSLKIEGGWDAKFEKRSPFGTPTKFGGGRAGPMLEFAAKDHLGSVALDGLLYDAQGSNKYDEKTNSLLKGTSCSFVLVRFNNLVTDNVTIANCVFMNSAHRAFETLIHPQSDKCEVTISNSIFLNCLIPVKLDTARGKILAAKLTVDHCSFLLNWAFNPDPDTSNPAALECAGKYAAKELVITNNLFYANFGGAIMNIEKVQTKVTVKNNNFVGNGLLHGDPDPGAAAMLVGAKKPISYKKIVDEEEDKTLGGNVSIAPGIPLALGDPKAVDAGKVKAEKGWENEVNRLLGKPLQGGKVAIKDFAPRKDYDPANPPFPTNDEAKKYGASPELVK